MSKFVAGQRVKFRGDTWEVHSAIDTEDPSGRCMYWIIKNKGRYDEDVIIVFESDLEGYWESWGSCTCGSDKVGHPSHSRWCDKTKGNRYYV